MVVLKTVESIWCIALIVLFSCYLIGIHHLFNGLCYAVVAYSLFSLVVILCDVEGDYRQQSIEAVALGVLLMYLLFFVCK